MSPHFARPASRPTAAAPTTSLQDACRDPQGDPFMSSREIASSVLSGILHCLAGSCAAGLLSAVVLLAIVRLLA